MDRVLQILKNLAGDIYSPKVNLIDIVEILILSVIIYYCILWIRNTRAYTLIKGLLILFAFLVIAYILQMNTILWIMKSVATVALTALVVIFQPELRKALEELGKKNVFSSILPFDLEKPSEDKFTENTLEDLVRAVYDMSEVKTGALIVLEQDISLNDYINTGIMLDSLLSTQLLVNIFEHNTPLHDGAVIVRGNRIISATCYLPLSDNNKIGKHLGTRHRAGLGISEVSDCFTIIVSEETGRVSYAYGGKLERAETPEQLKSQLKKLQKNEMEDKKAKKAKIWKGWDKNEKVGKKAD